MARGCYHVLKLADGCFFATAAVALVAPWWIELIRHRSDVTGDSPLLNWPAAVENKP